jgi:mercuric ion transport protein
MSRSLFTSVGAVGSAFASALCCVGPILYVSLGVGAGLASTFEPLRPWFLGGALLLLALAFRDVYGRSAETCVAEGECKTEEEARRALKHRKIGLWAAVALVLAFATFPTWSTWLT